MYYYRVCKIKNDRCDMHKDFVDELQAESYARDESLRHIDYAYQLKIIEDDVADSELSVLKIFVQGGLTSGLE
jgi:hypothetical protein